jgi:ADP-heptose:LPS heptosyltransferase
MAWDMQGLLRSGLMLASARVVKGKGWGRRDGREGSTLFYRKIAAPPEGFPAHAVAVLLPFLETMGLPPRLTNTLELELPKPGWASFFNEAANSPRVVLFLDSRGARKIWGGFEALTHLLYEAVPDLRLAWCAGEHRQPACELPEARFLNLSGCPFEEMLALCAQPSLFVGNDSGPMHLAAALGNPVVALFGPTSPHRFAPWPPESSAHAAICAPGDDLAKLNAETVFATVVDKLERARQTPAP